MMLTIALALVAACGARARVLPPGAVGVALGAAAPMEGEFTIAAG